MRVSRAIVVHMNACWQRSQREWARRGVPRGFHEAASLACFVGAGTAQGQAAIPFPSTQPFIFAPAPSSALARDAPHTTQCAHDHQPGAGPSPRDLAAVAGASSHLTPAWSSRPVGRLCTVCLLSVISSSSSSQPPATLCEPTARPGAWRGARSSTCTGPSAPAGRPGCRSVLPCTCCTASAWPAPR